MPFEDLYTQWASPSSPHLFIDGIECSVSFGPDGTSEGIVESWPDTGPTADAFYWCPYYDRYNLANALMGYSYTVDGVTVRTSPHQWPTSPKLRCKSIGSIQMWGLGVSQAVVGDIPAGWPYGAFAIIPAHYETLRYSVSGEPSFDLWGQSWTTTRLRISGDVFTPPNGAFKYVARPLEVGYPNGASAGVPVSDSLLGIVRPQVEISVTRHRVPSGFSVADIMAFIGSVNKYTLYLGDQEFVNGMLLFAGFNATEQFSPTGDIEYEIEYGILGRSDYGWNTIMAPDTEWYLVNTDPNALTDIDGKYPFKYLDFSLIP